MNPLDAVLHIKNIAEKENAYSTQNAYLLHFLEGHLSSLHSHLTEESPKPCKINVSSTLKKKHVITRLRI